MTPPISILPLALCPLLLSAQTQEQSDLLFAAIRNGDSAAVRAALAEGVPDGIRDAAGNTPLMAAAFYADGTMVELLLKAGADVQASNAEGASALMRAATDAEKVKILLAHGADAKHRSHLGNDALILAARRNGNSRAVQVLLEHGAEVSGKNCYGATALMAAVAAEDAESVRLLMEAGADIEAQPNGDIMGAVFGGGRTPLMWAAYRGNAALVESLLEQGANVNGDAFLGGALTQAAWANRVEVARTLLEAGAEVDGRDRIANFTPLHWAASSEIDDAGLVRLLLDRGADVHAEGGQPVDNFLGVTPSPLLLALKRGQTQIVETLRDQGAKAELSAKGTPKETRLAESPADLSGIADSIEAALLPIERTALESPNIFRRHASKQNCISCHQQQLPLLAIGAVRSRGLPVDGDVVERLKVAIAGDFSRNEALAAEVTFYPEPAIEFGYALWGGAMAGDAATSVSDSLVHHLAVVQCPDGHWSWNLPRPPIQSSDIAATALGLNALKHYPLPARKAEFAKRVERARDWLSHATPETNEERVYQLLGLAWGGCDLQLRTQLAEELIGVQRTDGGWSQVDKLPGDAYATGQALYALMTAGEITSTHEAIKRGLRFLLASQLRDGTWHVRSRAFPFQPPMESAFSHGADSWISTAATSWAIMALATAFDASQTSKSSLTLRPETRREEAFRSTDVRPDLAIVDFVTDIKPILERSCLPCHSGDKPKGNYRVTDASALLQEGNRGTAVVVPGQSAQSLLLRVVTDQIEDLEMPPLAKRNQYPPLTPDEIVRIRAWIDRGANAPEGGSLGEKES